MNENEIEKGVIVRLKSGGPLMTVRSVSGSLAYCEWFTEEHRRLGTFEISTLQEVQQPGTAGTATGS